MNVIEHRADLLATCLDRVLATLAVEEDRVFLRDSDRTGGSVRVTIEGLPKWAKSAFGLLIDVSEVLDIRRVPMFFFLFCFAYRSLMSRYICLTFVIIVS